MHECLPWIEILRIISIVSLVVLCSLNYCCSIRELMLDPKFYTNYVFNLIDYECKLSNEVWRKTLKVLSWTTKKSYWYLLKFYFNFFSSSSYKNDKIIFYGCFFIIQSILLSKPRYHQTLYGLDYFWPFFLLSQYNIYIFLIA